MNLRFYLFISGVNQGNGGRRGEFKISLCYPRGSGAFPQFYRERGGGVLGGMLNLMCVESLKTESHWCLVFVLLEADATLGDGSGIWEHLYSN